jgi:lipopolysaccharide transport system ATP-binding protein
MSSVVIKAEGLGKKYVITKRDERADFVTARAALTDSFARGAKKLSGWAKGELSGSGQLTEDVWALSDVSFQINKGEVVGLVGRNGAGKSTLLKLLSRITEPTVGRAVIDGQVASLLEVGTGFHPELTGRENVFLNGAILGMSRAEVRRRFDEIVAFAGVAKFLDTPVKRYSSGMYVRLAFSVAAHLEPDILIVDEVLAVGDAEFQKKCLGKIGEISHVGGRTVLVVSHNMGLITSLCDKAMLLEQGRLTAIGAASDVVNKYYTGGAGSPYELDTSGLGTRIGDHLATLLGARVETIDKKPSGEINIGSPFRVVMRFEILQPGEGQFTPVFQFRNAQGQSAFMGVGSGGVDPQPGIYEAACIIPGNLLNNDVYFIDIGLQLVRLGGHFCFNEPSALSVTMVDPIAQSADGTGVVNHFIGAVRPRLDWDIKKIA